MMCLIVDANVASLVFVPDPADDFQPVQAALFQKKATAVYGGQLAREYARLKKLSRLLVELDRQGILRKMDDRAVDQMMDAVVAEALCISDDPHIVALARVSKVRLLCSHDQDLHADFTNPKILKPRGSVYQRRSHRHLIRKHCGKKR
jgi:hypothetical protein